MRSSTEVYLRNCASAGGSRDSSSRRKYSDTNRSPPVKPAALAELGAPACIDSAARYRPAGQPSVRSVSSASSLASSSTPAASSSSLGLSLVQPEVRHADLVHQAVRPPAGERQRRVFPARDRDLRAGGNVLEQRRKHVQTGRIGDGVQVVEHQHQRALERTQCAPDPRDAVRPGGSALGPTAPRTPRRGPARRRESRPRCSAGTPRRRRLARRAQPTRRDADQPRPTSQATSSCRTRRARPRSRTARSTRTACDRVRLRHGARPGRRRSELDLHEVEGNFSEGHSRGQSYGPGPAISYQRDEEGRRARA